MGKTVHQLTVKTDQIMPSFPPRSKRQSYSQWEVKHKMLNMDLQWF